MGFINDVLRTKQFQERRVCHVLGCGTLSHDEQCRPMELKYIIFLVIRVTPLLLGSTADRLVMLCVHAEELLRK